MNRFLCVLLTLLLVPALATADELAANLSGPGQGFGSIVTGNGQVSFVIVTNGIGAPTRAFIAQGNNVFLELNAGFEAGSAAGSVTTNVNLTPLESNPANFSLRVQGPGGELSGSLALAGEGPGGGDDTGGDDTGGDDTGGDDTGGDDTGGDDTGGGDDAEGPDGELIETGDTSPCVEDETTLCLNGDRFEVTITFTRPQTPGTPEIGNAVELTSDTGYFWFFAEANVELVVKVINACNSAANRYWVFAGGLTDVEVELLVRDSSNGIARRYVNPQQNPFRPIQSTSAFDTCP